MASGGGEASTANENNENVNASSSLNCNINTLLSNGSDNSGVTNIENNIGTISGNGSGGTDNNSHNNMTLVLQATHTFHPRCGRRITLSNGYRTAMRSVRDFSHALVFSAEPLINDVLFEVIIERKNNSWGGSIEIGVTQEPPDKLELLSSATAMRNGTWVVSGTEVRCNGESFNECYGVDLETLVEGDRIGIMRTHKSELVVYVNGESLGVADFNMPEPLWALVNLYGRCVQVSLWPIDVDSSSRDYTESVQQQIIQSIDVPLSVDVSVASNGASNPSITSLAESANNASLSFVNALTTARNLYSSLPPPLLFSCQQNNNVLGNSNSGNSVTDGTTNPISSISSTQNTNDFYDMNERLRFHTRCGSLVKLSTNFRSAERRRPLDEFNNGVVMTHRPLKDNELFEIRIDKLVDKWSGSIEVGVTTHNPTVLHFPATMTNMRSGTIMMSGCGILTNGKGTRRQYGEFNLDELAEGDRVGMMRKANGNLHYYINGQDQGIAATRVASTLWGVIDLYGMTIKVTIVDRDEREQQNLVTRRNNLLLSTAAAAAAAAATACASTTSLPPLSGVPSILNLHNPETELQINGGINGSGISANGGGDSFTNGFTIAMNVQRNDDRLTFNPLCGSHAQVTHSGRTALRPNASDDFNNGVVLTRRPLRPNELFQVRLERVVSKWAGSVEMGVTIYSAEELEFPFTMTNVRTGTWMMTGSGVMQNGVTVIEQFGHNLDRLQVGDRVGVMRKDDGSLHFWVNGVDQGLAATGVPERVYGVIDLYGQAAQASIVDSSECGSPDTGNSTISNTTLYSEPSLRFHVVHGKNASISNGGLTASRPNSLAEFNDSIVFSNRPLRQRELFEVVLENMVRHWSGNVEIGVTGTRPEDITLSTNATDLEAPETIILCGSMLFYNRKTIRSNVPMDLDSLSANTRVGVMRNGDFIHFFINGVDQGSACECRTPNVWAIVDLYGQCAQVSLTQTQPAETPRVAPYATSENSQSCQATSVIQPATLEMKHRWTCISGMVQLSQNWTVASRLSGTTASLSRCLVFSEHPLRLGSPFEIRILVRNAMLAGCLSIGITDLNLSDDYVRRNLPINMKCIPANVWYLSGNELRHNMRLLQRSATSLEWLRADDRISLELTTGRTLRVLFNSEDMNIHFKHVAKNPYVVVELHGSTMAIQATSSQAPMSPLRPCILRLQDSLDFGADPLNKQDSMLESMESEVLTFEFFALLDSNVRLQSDNRSAVRVQSFNKGIIFGNRALSMGETISIKIDKVNPKWQGTIGVGVVGFCPVLLERTPQSILHLSRRCWGITKDYININGQRIPSNYGERLDHIQPGTIITLALTFTNMLIITVGGTTLEEVGTLPNVVYPIFDLYGKCEQVTALVMPNNDTLLNNTQSTPAAAAPSIDTATTTTNATVISSATSTIATPATAICAAMIVNSTLHDVEMMTSSALNNVDVEHNLSREKADLECHEKETNEASGQTLTEFNDGDDDGLVSLHSSPGNTNLAAGLNRSVMESVSENLLTNLSIKCRSLEQQIRQADTNISNSAACCLRESLQLQHHTNLNIQRSQSTQRFQQQQQQQQQNQTQQQQNQQQITQNINASLVPVHDTNREYDVMEDTNCAEANVLLSHDDIGTHQHDDNSNSSSLNSARNRVTIAFGNFLAHELLNDSSSTGRDRLLDDSSGYFIDRSVMNIMDAALNDSMVNSSSSTCSTRERWPNTRNSNTENSTAAGGAAAVVNGHNAMTARSTDNLSNCGSNLGMCGRVRLLRLSNALRANDLLLDNSGGAGDNPSVRLSDEQLTNDLNDCDFATIMSPQQQSQQHQWRSQSPTNNIAFEYEISNGQRENPELDMEDSSRNNDINVLRLNANALRASATAAAAAVAVAAARNTTLAGNIDVNFDTLSIGSSSLLNPGTSYESVPSQNVIERRDCAYLKLVKQFFTSLVLPQIFFSSLTDAICYCDNCNMSNHCQLDGWVCYNLDVSTANANEPPALLTENDQYLCMYYITRVDKIRAILDYGQLVPQGQNRDSDGYTPFFSVQKDEPGTRLELHFTPEVRTAIRKNGHLRFTHNGKQYRIGAAFEVFVRNQALCSLPSNRLSAICGSNRGDLHSLANVSSSTSASAISMNTTNNGANGSGGIGNGSGGSGCTIVATATAAPVGGGSAGGSGNVSARSNVSNTSNSNASNVTNASRNNVNTSSRVIASARSVASMSSDGSGGGGVSSGPAVPNSTATLSTTNSIGSITELTWFTKEDGACFINALVLRLEEYSGDDDSIDSILDDFN